MLSDVIIVCYCAIEAWVAAWRSGEIQHGSYFEWYRNWKLHADHHPDQVLLVCYEDILRDPRTLIKSIAQFLGLSLFSEENENDALLGAIFQQISFSSMKAAGGELGTLHLRKGICGDWRNHFTPELAESIKEQFRQECAGTGLAVDLGEGEILEAY